MIVDYVISTIRKCDAAFRTSGNMAAAAVETQDGKPVIDAKVRGPGPAKYRLPGTVGYSNHDPTKRRDPAFSFGKRFVVKVMHSIYSIENFASELKADKGISIAEFKQVVRSI